MNKRVFVPDASVLLKWAFAAENEQDRDPALQLLDAWLGDSAGIIVPRLWSFEVANVLKRKKPEAADAIMDIFLGYEFPEAETTRELCRTAFDLMERYSVTFYDAAYHAVAVLSGGTMLTADERYVAKVGNSAHVRHIRQFSRD